MLCKRLQAHLPWLRCREFLPRILDLGLAPEVAFKGPELDGLDGARLDAVARLIAATGRRPTVHAPFFDLSPGAMEPLVRQITLQRLTQALQAAERLGAHLMVVHPGYDRWRYPKLAATWADHAATTFAPLVDLAEQLDCRLALENIYEETTETLTGLVDRFDTPWFGHCYDIGHWRLFGRQVQEQWLERIAPRLLHLHLHDNHGLADDHLPVGEGSIDFTPLRRLLSGLAEPPSITLEAHDPEDLRRSLRNFTSLFAKEPQP
ncbi:MAG: sugar phosphate isomerase/epimerase [Deltaproteobacteria bacterium]|nr:MAG: sugar phosphate isomerase/epimerase [Deltaproteobacteria bacterium]